MNWAGFEAMSPRFNAGQQQPDIRGILKHTFIWITSNDAVPTFKSTLTAYIKKYTRVMLYRRSTWEIYEGHKYSLWERTHFHDGNVGGTIKEYLCYTRFNALRTGDADLRFYITTVQDGWRKSAILTRACFLCTIHLIIQYIEPVSEWSCWRMFIETWLHSELTFRHRASSI